MADAAATICSEALRLLGEMQISSFDEGTPQADTAALLWQGITDALLADYPWRFTLRWQQLSQMASPPPNNWPYAYQLPAMLALRQVTATGLPHDLTLSAWDRQDDLLLTDSATAWAQYQVTVTPARWPPYFRQLARYALAAEFAIAITDRADLAQYWTMQAFGTPGEQRQGGMLRRARQLDAQQQPAVPFPTDTLITARNGII